MAALSLPCTIFRTQKWMDDYSACDMRSGDLSAAQLNMQFHLLDISTRVNPFTLTKITPFSQPHSRFHGSRCVGEKVSRQACAAILFDEFRHLSRPFALYGPYKSLIEKMIIHMQKGDGQPFRDMSLDSALREHILRDNTKNSTRVLLEKAFERNIDWEKKSQ